MNENIAKAEWENKLKAMSEIQLRQACSEYIWLSAYASNNLRSEYHWKCDLCWDECCRRNRRDLYTEEHNKLTQRAQ